MLQVATHVGTSPLHGLGLFAESRIARGEIVWVFDPRFDLLFRPEEIPTLPTPMRTLLKEHSFLCRRHHVRVLSMDNDRWTNHAESPNIRQVMDDTVWGYHFEATDDIRAGEELTNDYREFCADIADIPENDYLFPERAPLFSPPVGRRDGDLVGLVR